MRAASSAIGLMEIQASPGWSGARPIPLFRCLPARRSRARRRPRYQGTARCFQPSNVQVKAVPHADFPSSVDQRRLRAAQRVRPEQARVQADHRRPSGDEPCILPRGEAPLFAPATAEEEAARPSFREAKILVHGLAGLFGDLEADRTPGFLLPHGGSLHGVAMRRNVLDLQAHHIATAELAVDGEIEQSKVAHLALHLQPGANGPDVLGLQGRFRANELAFVPRSASGGRGIYVLNSIHGFSPFTSGETPG